MAIYKSYDVELKSDHLYKYSNVSPVKGLEEIIWNSLDADASEIIVKLGKNEAGCIEKIIIEDDGHGLSLEKAESELTSLGGSFKKTALRSPNNRKYHGSQGAGRFKIFSIGNNVEIDSKYFDETDNTLKHIKISLDISNMKKFDIIEFESINNKAKTGTRITITNLSKKTAILSQSQSRESLAETFTAYHFNYPIFKIVFDSNEIDFSKYIKNTVLEDFQVELKGENQDFKLRIVEWKNTDFEKKLCFCGNEGITLEDKLHKLKLSIPVSFYIMSDYIESLHKENLLLLDNFSEELTLIIDKAKDLVKKYALQRMHGEAKEYIEELKKDNIYPYYSEPKNEMETIERQLFDITALQLKKFMPTSSTKKKTKNQKTKDGLTLKLIKEALVSSPSKALEIIKAVLNLSENEQSDFVELLEHTSLSAVLSTAKEVSDRLIKLEGFKSIIFGEYKDKILERKHLQKLLEKETWIFGDNYQLGAADNTLKNVLKKYLRHLGRDDFEEILLSEENADKIPDICLWQQYKKDYIGNKENLIIEIKKPTLTVGTKEYTQIQTYAQKIIQDGAFPKDKTFWTFYLLSNQYDESIAFMLNQKDRKRGVVYESDNCRIYIKLWSEILNDAEARLSYLSEKLQHQISENDGIKLLKKLHTDYLPKDLNENILIKS